MALSGRVNTSGYQGRYYYVTWSASQSIEGNGSTVYWTLGCDGGTSSWYAERTLVVNIAGNTVVNKSDRIQRYKGGITSGSIYIPHNSNGDASFSISIQAAVYGSSINCTGDGSFWLNNIPRKSELSVPTGILGEEQTISVTRKSNDFTHTIKYECGNYNGVICDKSNVTSLTWTPLLEFANSEINSTSVGINITIETFNGNSSIGSITKTYVYDIPNTIAPTVSFDVSDLTNNLSLYSAYVQHKSKLKIDIAAQGSYGSTIKTYAVNADDKYYGDKNVTTDIINNSGDLLISTSVTDSRGRTAFTTKNIKVLEYNTPQISNLQVRRSNADGSSNSGGQYLCVIFTANVSALNNKNTSKYVIKYKKKQDSSFIDNVLNTYNGVYTVTEGKYIFKADIASSYDIVLEVTDSFTSVSRSGTGSVTKKLFSWLSRGLGFAFGKVAEIENALEVAFDTYIQNNLYVNGSVVDIQSEKVHVSATQGLTYDIPVLDQGDCNELIQSGKYYIGDNGKNRPSAQNGWLESQLYSTDYCYQSFISNTGDSYERIMQTGVWGDWSQLADKIIAQGISGIWHYKKYRSGLAEIWGQHSLKTTNLYGLGLTMDTPAYPFPFISSPVITATFGAESDANACLKYVKSVTTKAEVYGYCKSTNISCWFNIQAIGMYK